MPKENLVAFFGGNDDLVSKLTINQADYSKDAVIRVDEHRVALIIRDGVLEETLRPGIYKLFDKQSKLAEYFSGAGHVEVVYITIKVPLEWNTNPPVDVLDPATQYLVRVFASGQCEIAITDPAMFYRDIVRGERFFKIDNLRDRVLSRFMYEFRTVLADIIIEKQYSYYNITSKMREIGTSALPGIKDLFKNRGIEMTDFSITYIMIPDSQVKELEYKRQEMRDLDDLQKLAKEKLADMERLRDKEKEHELELLKIKVNTSEQKKCDERFCTKCGTKISDSLKFCGNCGEKAKFPCNRCGNVNMTETDYCGYCGNLLKEKVKE